MSAVLINPIHTDEDHEAALREIEQLWNAESSTPEGDRLDILFTLFVHINSALCVLPRFNERR